MLWSLLKIVVFLAVAALLAFGAAWIVETPGEVRIAFGSREFFVSPIGFFIGVAVLVLLGLLLLKIVGFLVAVMRFLMGDETAISRYFSRSRERRGFNALSEGMVALAAGDPKAASKNAAKADRLLNRPDVTRLLNAQAAELNGDRSKAFDYYKDMLANDRTRFVGGAGADAAEARGGRHRHRDGAGQEGASRCGRTTRGCCARCSSCSPRRRTGRGRARR